MLDKNIESKGGGMRWVHVEEGLSLRFPARDAAFHEGVELGVLAALLNAGHGRVTHVLSAANLDQARALAAKMGYRITLGRRDGDTVAVDFWTGSARPRLTLVHDGGTDGAGAAA
jgi:hypothetical protein